MRSICFVSLKTKYTQNPDYIAPNKSTVSLIFRQKIRQLGVFSYSNCASHLLSLSLSLLGDGSLGWCRLSYDPRPLFLS